MFLEQIKEIHVEPTTVCQAECPMCPRTVQGYHLGKVANKHLTLDSFKQKVGSIVGDLEKVLFCGTLGEPAACGDLLDMIRWIKSVNPSCVIGLNSNGGIRDAAWWTELAVLIKDDIYSYVVFSIDGLEDTNHIYRRNVDWKKLIENASAFVEAGGSAHWDMLVFKHNEHQVSDARELAKSIGFKFFRTKVTSRFKPGDFLQPPTGHATSWKQVEFSCMAKATKSLYLSAEGRWYPCCFTHMSDESNFDSTWGKPINALSNISEWNELEESFDKDPPPVCSRSCMTTYNKGQWTSEWQLDV